MKLAPQLRSSFNLSSIGWSGAAGAEAAFGRRLPRFMLVVVSLAVVFMAAAIGIISPHLSLKIPLILVMAGALFVLVVKRPTWGIVLFLLMASTLIIPEYFTKWTSDLTSYLIYELVLVLLVARALLVKEKPTVFERLTASPVAIAMIAFAVLFTAKSLVIVIESRFSPHSFGTVFFFDKPISLYLLFIPAFIFLDTARLQKWAVKVIFFLGALVAGVVMLKIVWPSNIIFSQITIAQALQSDTPNVSAAVERLRPPGEILEMAVFWIGLMNLILRPWTWKRLAFYVPLTLLTLTGVLLEFNRSYFIPMAALTALVMFLNRKHVRLKLVSLAAIIVVILVVFGSATGTLQKYVDAIGIRYSSTFSAQTGESQSLTSRDIEDSFAWIAIKDSPAFGISLDELYRPPIPGMLDNLRWYIHDAYLWFWTYFGLAGLAAFASVLAAVILRGLFNWNRIQDPFLQAAVMGMLLTLATLVVADYVAPKFYEYATVPVLALAFGLTEAIIVRNQRLLADKKEAADGDGESEARK